MPPPRKPPKPRKPERLPRWLALARGRETEQRVLDACKLDARPDWMKSVRFASRDEDRAGIDVVFESDIGRLCLQVKSSMRGKAKFEERKRKARIALVVVGRHDSPATVLRRVVQALGALRARYLSEKRPLISEVGFKARG